MGLRSQGVHRGGRCRRHRGGGRAGRPGRHLRTARPRLLVILVDQEPEQNLGGQAFWSFGGLFFVDSPEQRRVRHQGLRRARLAGLAGHRRLRPPRRRGRCGRGAGPRPTCTSRRARSGPGCTSGACGSSRSSAGPSAAATPPPGTATRSRASTSPGAPARPSSRRSRAACARQPCAARCDFAFRHRVDELTVTDGAVDGVRGTVLEPSDVPRGRAEFARRPSATSSCTPRR